jgi:hypothetical protein
MELTGVDIPGAISGMAAGGTVRQSWTCHFHPCCSTMDGINWSLITCIRSRIILGGKEIIRAKAPSPFGRNGGRATFVAKKVSRSWRIQKY